MWGVLSLTREGVCRLQLLLILANTVILGFESRGSRDHILLSEIRYSPNQEGQVPVFISPRKRVAQIYPQALGSFFVASYDSQGFGGGIRIRLHEGYTTNSLLFSYDTDCVENDVSNTSPLPRELLCLIFA
jgi:hypothetical protein